ncbi:MAG: hypothetical protein V1809_14785 [Planctomycetota bacterium]
MKNECAIGLLPFYLELYDKVSPRRRGPFEGFLGKIEKAFAARGIQVVRADICRRAPEFRRAVAEFERAGVDAIVGVHLAYSPSLEAAGTLCGTDLPLILMDTTLDAAFGFGTDPSRVMFNHGIHGVMDLASVLRRRGRHFEIVAGAFGPALRDRAAGLVRAARAARAFRGMTALRIGESFRGMGDFAVEESLLRRRFGIRVKTIPPEALLPDIRRIPRADVAAEMKRDRAAYRVALPADVHACSVRTGLAIRRRLAREGAGAFSFNFLAFDGLAGRDITVPFLEASKAMARGVGYAGEGDVLTAAFMGALARGFGLTTFTEIFCPDWRGNSLYLSHMGEVNPEFLAGRPRLLGMDFKFGRVKAPAYLAGSFAPGAAVYADIVPGPGGTFSVIASPVRLATGREHPGMARSIRGWMRPSVPVPEFLEEYARAGGTHHAALVRGATPEAVAAFARFAGMECRVIGEV